MIPLHYSFSNQAHTNPLFHYSLQVSLDAALAIISPEPDTGFAQLITTEEVCSEKVSDALPQLSALSCFPMWDHSGLMVR